MVPPIPFSGWVAGPVAGIGGLLTVAFDLVSIARIASPVTGPPVPATLVVAPSVLVVCLCHTKYLKMFY